jgi:choline dehydrogenase-like flavoprotein
VLLSGQITVAGTMYIVVGSGHAGVACAVPLVEAGMPVTMIDGGLQLEQETQRVVARMAGQPQNAWSADDLGVIKGNVSASAKGVQVKKLYGSDFPFRGVDQHLPRMNSGIGHLTPTLSTGGFSNVWGAAALPYSESDLRGWPISAKDLEPFYRSVNRFMPLTGAKDGLEELFPLTTDHPGRLRPSRQSERILRSLQRRESRLRKRGLIFGMPRLAVRAQSSSLPGDGGGVSSSGCSYCGLCLFGCPYGYIYSTNETLAYLKTFPNFRHVSGVVVDTFHEEAGKVAVHGRSLNSEEKVMFAGEKLFLAAGILSTSQMVMRALGMYDTPIRLPTSEYFMLPMLSVRKTAGVRTEHLHTLSQIFLECTDKRVSEHSAHMQLYTYSELFKLGLYESFGPLRPLLKLFEPEILGRLSVIQGYLHSSCSSSIELRLTKRGTSDLLILTGHPAQEAKATIKRLVSKLRRELLPSGLIPVSPMLNVGQPGEGRHAGGSFPMSADPSARQTDLLGRPSGFRKVHIVDATVFPTIPASTITFTAMANAQRIASEVISSSKTS